MYRKYGVLEVFRKQSYLLTPPNLQFGSEQTESAVLPNALHPIHKSFYAI
tara:strand:+ start:460 stop:609 length:150 start_codon:yes stop_codon:yes gene_type:complete